MMMMMMMMIFDLKGQLIVHLSLVPVVVVMR